MKESIQFSEMRFPTEISYGSVGGPEYSTNIAATSNSHEQRNINWSQARCVYNIAHGIKNKKQLSELISFFRAHKGRAIGFRYKDWCDYSVNQQIIADFADGQEKVFQLIKSYKVGDLLEERIINKPVADTIKIYFGDKIVRKDSYMLDSTTGKIIFVQPPIKGAAIRASFEFDVPVRFDVDRLESVIDSYGTYSWENIILLEIRL